MKAEEMDKCSEVVNEFYDGYWYAYEHELPIYKDDIDREKSMLWHFYKEVCEPRITALERELEQWKSQAMTETAMREAQRDELHLVHADLARVRECARGFADRFGVEFSCKGTLLLFDHKPTQQAITAEFLRKLNEALKETGEGE